MQVGDVALTSFFCRWTCSFANTVCWLDPPPPHPPCIDASVRDEAAVYFWSKPTCLSLCQCQQAFTTMALGVLWGRVPQCLQHHSVCLGLLSTHAPLWFHVNLRMLFPSSVKNVTGVLLGIAMTQITFANMTIFTLRILSVQADGRLSNVWCLL